MVVFAVAVLSKAGKLLLSRQYADMQRMRVEGLLAAFPKLLADSGSKQHTFVETPQVRYLYHPLENMYIVLLTNKASNVMEDLDTLRMLSKVVPDHCVDLTEESIEQSAFRLIFAFDEMITFGGYKVHLSLHDIHTNLEMNSATENAFNETKMQKEEEAKRTARDNEARIREARRNQISTSGFGGGGGMGGGGGGGFDSPLGGGSGGGYGGGGYGGSVASSDYGRSSRTSSHTSESSDAYTSRSKNQRGLKLGKKKKGNKFSKFAKQLAKEDNIVIRSGKKKGGVGASASGGVEDEEPVDTRDFGDVHSVIKENLKVLCNRDGTCESLEVKGSLTLTAHSSKGQLANVKMNRGTNAGDFKIQPNPNVNRKAWAAGVIAPKSESRPFPLRKGVPVLRWRMEKRDDTPYLPVSINAWPEAGRKTTSVNIEYQLERESMTLHEFVVSIPLGTSETPDIVSCDGTTHHNRKEERLEWVVQVVDEKNKTGTLEFEIAQPDEDAFFPMDVSFQSKETMMELSVASATSGSEAIKTTEDTGLSVLSFRVGDAE
eukprot:g2376.t1